MRRPASESISTNATVQPATWLSWTTCPYTDPLAIFRFYIPHHTGASHLVAHLQPQEISHAERYHRQEDQHRFIYTRSLLRILLGKYSQQEPSQINFAFGRNRKPELKDRTDWHFNVSHSGNCLLIAIGRDRVGIDLEKIDPAFSFDDIVALQFSESEKQYVNASADRRAAFYQLWTRKEALVKATAKGVDDDFRQIPSLDGVHAVGSALIGSTGHWLVNSFPVLEEYAAAVAYPATTELPTFYALDGAL